MFAKNMLVVVIAFFASGLMADAVLAQNATTFPASQADRGSAKYAAMCSMCHMADLHGSKDFPALAGERFKKGWTGRSARELFLYMKLNMPADRPGELPEKDYLDIIAHILRTNGFKPAKSGNDLGANDLRQIVFE